jgi:hypothetical protein
MAIKIPEISGVCDTIFYNNFYNTKILYILVKFYKMANLCAVVLVKWQNYCHFRSQMAIIFSQEICGKIMIQAHLYININGKMAF